MRQDESSDMSQSEAAASQNHPMPRVDPIGRGRVVDEVLERLEQMIAGQPDGARLPTEAELCTQLNVSRTSVRAAIQRLAERQVVSVEVGRGTFVRRPDRRQLSEQLGLLVQLDRHSFWQVTEARRIVETQIAGLAATRRGEEHTDAMLEALELMDRSMQDSIAFAEGDERFHIAVAAAAENEVLGMFDQQLQAMIRQARHDIFKVIEIPTRAQDYHWAIYRAIEAERPEEAVEAAAGHLDEMERYVREMLAAREAGSAATR